jgi:hypothetical protein
MVMGLLIQVPWILASYIFPDISHYWAILSVIASSGAMLYMHIYRVRSLGISKYYTWSWFISLQTTAALWMYYYYLS